MEQKQTQELKEILTNNEDNSKGNLYDFVCNNYWQLSKEELKDMLKEAVALLYTKAEAENIENGKPYDDYKKLYSEYFENLKENTTIFED